MVSGSRSHGSRSITINSSGNQSGPKRKQQPPAISNGSSRGGGHRLPTVAGSRASASRHSYDNPQFENDEEAIGMRTMSTKPIGVVQPQPKRSAVASRSGPAVASGDIEITIVSSDGKSRRKGGPVGGRDRGILILSVLSVLCNPLCGIPSLILAMWSHSNYSLLSKQPFSCFGNVFSSSRYKAYNRIVYIFVVLAFATGVILLTFICIRVYHITNKDADDYQKCRHYCWLLDYWISPSENRKPITVQQTGANPPFRGHPLGQPNG